MPQATAGSDHNPNMQKKPAEQDVLLVVVVGLLLLLLFLPGGRWERPWPVSSS